MNYKEESRAPAGRGEKFDGIFVFWRYFLHETPLVYIFLRWHHFDCIEMFVQSSIKGYCLTEVSALCHTQGKKK